MKTDKDKKILDKIRNLLVKGNDEGTTEAEAEAFLMAAQRLMVQYNINEKDIKISPLDVAEDEMERNWVNGERQLWSLSLLNIIGRSNNCTVFLDEVYDGKDFKKVYRTVGFEMDREATKIMFDITIKIIRELYKRRYQEYKADVLANNGKYDELTPISYKRFLTSFIDGFIVGLHMKLHEDKKQVLKLEGGESYSLVVVEKKKIVEEHVKKNHNLKSISGKTREINQDAFGTGVSDGKNSSNKNQLHG